MFQAVRDGTANLWALNEHGGLFRSRPPGTGAVDDWADEYRRSRPEPRWQESSSSEAGGPGENWYATMRNPGNSSPYLSGISAMGLDFSRDGEWVAYNDGTDGTMWRSKVDGTQKLQLVSPPMLAYLPRWSPDGKRDRLLWSSTRRTLANLCGSRRGRRT